MAELLTQNHYFPDPNFPLAVAWRDPQPQFARHRHQFSELMIVTAGSAIHVIGKERFTIGRGDVFILGSDQEHEFIHLDNLSLVNILFDGGKLGLDQWASADLPGFRALFLLEPEYREGQHCDSYLALSSGEVQRVTHIVNELEKEMKEGIPGFKLASLGWFRLLLTHLSRAYQQAEKPQSVLMLRISEAITFMEEHYTEAICFEKLANIAHMSLRNFQRIFRRCMGITAHQYLQKLRIDHARELLTETDLPISELAIRCGFKDSNYFTRTFRQHCNSTPSSWRQNSQYYSL